MAEDNSGTFEQLQTVDGEQAEVIITIDSGKMEPSRVEYRSGEGTEVKTPMDTSESIVPMRAEVGKETVVKLAEDTSETIVPMRAEDERQVVVKLAEDNLGTAKPLQTDDGKATEAKTPMDNSATKQPSRKETKVKTAKDTSGAIEEMQIERGEETDVKTAKDNSGTIDQMGIDEGEERTHGLVASFLTKFQSIPRPKIRCCTLEEFKKWMKDPNNILFVLTIASVFLGVVFGCAMRSAGLSEGAIELIKFPGDLLMSMLKMLMIPLIVSSLISGMSQLDAKSSGKMGSYTLVFYISTTVLAAILGIIIIVTVHPGNPDHRLNTTTSSFNATAKEVKSEDAFLDLFKNMFPDNLIKACTSKKITKRTCKPLLPPVSTTLSPPVSTTLSPSVSTTLSPPVSTTLSPPVSTTLSPSVSTTLSPPVSTTLSPPVSTTLSPPVSTTLSPPVSTTLSPSVSNAGSNAAPEFNQTKTKNKRSNADQLEPSTTVTTSDNNDIAASNTSNQDNQTDCKTEKKTEDSDGTNVLGLVCFSIAFGIVLGQLGPAGKPMVDFFIVLNEVTMRLVRIIIWYSPFGILCLISGNILAIDKMAQTAQQLGLFIIAVSVGLIIHGAGTLPLIYYVITRKNPITFFKGIKQAWVTALGTASSAATLPVTFRCLEENLGIDKRVTHFVLPVGATINMDGTALYEAMAAIFIAQMQDEPLGFGQLVTVSITATLASIGAASIPGAGLVSVIMVLTVLGLDVEDVAMIAAVDWLLDRIRTSVNVVGDSYGAGIVAHLSRDELDKQEMLREEEENKEREIEEGGNRRKSRLSIIRRKDKPVLVDDDAEM